MPYIFKYAFLNVLNMSVTASLVIMAVVIIRMFIRKLPKKFSYILWIIPAVRLICPVSVSFSISMFNFFKPKVEQNRMEYISQNLTPIPANTTVAIPEPAASDRNTTANYIAHRSNSVTITDILVFIWFIAAVILLTYFIISYIGIFRRIRYSREKQGYYECADIDTPFVFGLFRPKIYVPENLSDSVLECVLAHENAHIKRHDHVIKVLCVIIAVIHWFNPLVWAAYRLMSSDMELSCDEKALENMKGGMKKTYASSLLNVSLKQNRISLTAITSFGESSVKRRIKHILSIKKPNIFSVIFTVFLIIAAAVTMLTNAETAVFKATSKLLSIDVKDENIFDDIRYPVVSENKASTQTVYTTISTKRNISSAVSSVNAADSSVAETQTTLITTTRSEIKTENSSAVSTEPQIKYTADDVISLEYANNVYSLFGYLNSTQEEIEEKEIGEKLYDGNINIIECRQKEDDSDICRIAGSIYNVRNISDDVVIAVKYKGTDNYRLYTNISYYSPTVSDFINNFSLKETLCLDSGYKHSAQHSCFDINDKGYQELITEYYDIDSDFVIDVLLDNANAPRGSSDYVRLESPDYSIYCFISSLNTRISFNIYEKAGYISAGAEEFYIGEEKAREIVGKIQSEYSCCETLIDDGVNKYKVKGKYNH